MCTRPITLDGNTFACRSCDACIASRRSGWIARAMAEKSIWPYTLCLALTYGEDTQASRDAASLFNYADVSAFLKRLRQAMFRIDPTSRLKFICAGEQGDRNGRVHWHLILYSDLDLTSVGSFSRLSGPVTDRSKMLSTHGVGGKKVRLHWTLWAKDESPIGFVTLQEPDQGGMSYVLSYCLKDQFTQSKSFGTARSGKVENFATGLFRMSKRPPVGHVWLMRKMEALDASGSVLPSLNLKVPEMSGYWYPSGISRATLLWGFQAINQRSRWYLGRNSPQWSSLLSSLADNPVDLDILEPKHDKETFEEFAAKLHAKQAERVEGWRHAEIRSTCGGHLPCDTCLATFTEGFRRSIGVLCSGSDAYGNETFETVDGFPVEEIRNSSGDFSRSGAVNIHCRKFNRAEDRADIQAAFDGKLFAVRSSHVQVTS